MLLGIIILKRSYTPSKYSSVLLITFGIILSTVASTNLAKSTSATKHTVFSPTIDLFVGISMLTFALFASALLGVFQEMLFARFGKHPKEMGFYTHALPLPGFLLLFPDFLNQVQAFNESLPFPVLGVPRLWIFLFFCALTQYFCVNSVFGLISESSSLTVTLVITLRKFLSLLFSIIYFRNPFTALHWCSAVMIFFGSFLFAEVFQIEALLPKRVKVARSVKFLTRMFVKRETLLPRKTEAV